MNRHILFIYAAVLFGLASCSDFLDEPPVSSISEGNFYQTEADAETALIAVYGSLQNTGYWGLNVLHFTSTSAEEAKIGAAASANREIQSLDENSYDASLQFFGNAWTSLYRTVNLANGVIERVSRMPLNSAQKDRILAEAKFLRALSYFNLVRLFGPVPLQLSEVTAVDEQSEIYPSSATVPQIYQQIITDLTEAEAKLLYPRTPATRERANRGAVTTLLAKAYLTLAGDETASPYWAMARDKCKEVMDSARFSLQTRYTEVFRPANKNNTEHIFSVQFLRGGSEASQYNTTLAQNGTAVFQRALRLGHWGYQGNDNLMPEPAFYNAFPNTFRKEVTFVDSVPSSATAFRPILTGARVFKYYDPDQIADNNTGNNFNVLRYADVLLMFAEAENEVSGPSASACKALNDVRLRARRNANGTEVIAARTILPDIQPADVSKEQLRDIILQERAWELCYEGHRRWDLIRRNRYIATMQQYNKPVPADADFPYFPKPQKEMDLNPNL